MPLFHPGPNECGTISGRCWRAWAILLAVCAVGLWADQYSKSWAFERVAGGPVELDATYVTVDEPSLLIPPHEGVDPLPGPLIRFRLALNQGAVFGVGAGRKALLILLTVTAIIGAIGVFALRTYRNQPSAHLAIGCIVAGGVGNLIDRLRFGVVRDFIQMFPESRLPRSYQWPGGSPELMPWVFNIADLLLLAGTVLFLGVLWRNRLLNPGTQRSTAAAPSDEAASVLHPDADSVPMRSSTDATESRSDCTI